VLKDFETRLADVLGARLAPPLAGAVDVAPGAAASRIVLGVVGVQPLDDDLLSLRPETVPGDASPRRVLKLRCAVELDVRVPDGGGRADQMAAMDQVLYALDDGTLRSGAAFVPGDGSDPGFLIRSLAVATGTPPAAITLTAEGFFWPAGTPGETGRPIVEARLRAAIEPLLLDPFPDHFVAGGAALPMTLRCGAGATMVVSDAGVAQEAFGSLALALVDAGGRPGAGTLGGGTVGPAGTRLYAVADGAIAFSYTPPAAPATDFLRVTLDDGSGNLRLEIARFPLRVRGA
jgi:hypothetical protein